MRTAKVVIGANYGDEGKGLTTDYLSSQLGEDTVVVRFNGGSQAGHTVRSPDGLRHVFGHFGSGTLLGCQTHLSRFFMVNPITFWNEYRELSKKGIHPRTTIDPDALVTTIYDMLLNQLSQRTAGITASCGLGINETAVRSEAFPIRMKDIAEENYAKKLTAVQNEWVPSRIKELKINMDLVKSHEFEILDKDNDLVITRSLEEGLIVLSKVIVIDDAYLSTIDNLVFEGAQGLLLDQDHKNFPWVTRSSTGVTNVLQLADDCDLTGLDLYYITRGYLTRHGHGPLPNSSNLPIYPMIVDETNITNKHQGSLRFAPLDFKEMWSEAVADASKAEEEDLLDSVNLAITCLDQCPEEVQEDLIAKSKLTGCRTVLTSYGPKRTDIKVS